MVDDSHRLTRAWQTLLARHPDLRLLAALHSPEGVIELVEAEKPDIVLLDLHLGELDAFDLLAQLARFAPITRTVIYSGACNPDLVDQALEHGAWGFTSKLEDPDQVITTIRRVAAGETVFPTF